MLTCGLDSGSADGAGAFWAVLDKRIPDMTWTARLEHGSRKLDCSTIRKSNNLATDQPHLQPEAACGDAWGIVQIGLAKSSILAPKPFCRPALSNP
jgi:hypothetical protein